MNDIIPEVTMNIPVLLEPIPTGFRASTGAPLNLAVEAPTEDEALTAIQSLLLTKQNAGAKIVELWIPPTTLMHKLTAADHEMLDQVDAAIKENRWLQRAEELGADAAADIVQSLVDMPRV